MADAVGFQVVLILRFIILEVFQQLVDAVAVKASTVLAPPYFAVEDVFLSHLKGARVQLLAGAVV